MNSMARYLVLVNHEKNEYFPEKCACCTLKNYYKTENILHRALRKILLKSQSPFIPVLFSHNAIIVGFAFLYWFIVYNTWNYFGVFPYLIQ